MNRSHSRRLAFRPSVDLLEGRRLLSHIANWDGMPNNATIVTYDDGRGAYAVPGMGLQVDVPVPEGYLGFRSVEIVVHSVLPYPSDTYYSQDTGKYVAGDLRYTTTWWRERDHVEQEMSAPDGPDYVQVDGEGDPVLQKFYAPKDEGTYTVSITAVAWYWDNSDMEPKKVRKTLTDSLTMKVEVPDVDSFKVIGKGPIHFGWMDKNKHPTDQANGVLFGFTTVPPAGDDAMQGFEFEAEVTNDTHYDITVGFMQEVNMRLARQYNGEIEHSLDSSEKYEDSDGFLLDVASATSVWCYNLENFGYWNIPSGETKYLGLPDPDHAGDYLLFGDSPNQALAIAKDAPGAPESILLQRLLDDCQFQTHLAIKMDGGIPISLSTAQWSIVGEAENLTATTLEDASDPSKWNLIQLEPKQAKDYPGDGKIEYLSWPASAKQELADFKAQGAFVQVPDWLFPGKQSGLMTGSLASRNFEPIFFIPPGSETLPPALNLTDGVLRHRHTHHASGGFRKDGWT
jgi:hypothetical protein